MTHWPSRLSGNSPLAAWLNQLLEKCKECEIKPGPDYMMKPLGTQGKVLLINQGTGGGGGGTGSDERIS